MAKKEKAEKKAAKPKAEKVEFKYTVADVAKALEIKEASARIRLRNAEVPKAGKVYGWGSDKDFKAVMAQLTAE